MAAQPQYTYQPQPNELPYYNALFSTADKSSSGHLSGAVAVEFLSLSKLPVDLLKQIWTMADQPPSNTLDMSKFYIAVRLIQLFQNGKKPIDLALNIADGEPMRPPFFDGVNVQAIMQQQQQGGGGASVAPQRPPMQQQLSSQQLAPPQQVQQPTPQGSPQRSPQLNGMAAQQPPAMAAMNGAPPTMSPNNQQQQQQLAIQDPYTMTPQELSRYEQLFPTYAVQEADGMYYVHGGAAVELFSKSGMPNEQLKSIWSMSDSPIDNKLDSIEFAIAMHLIVCVTKKGLSMPPSLPPSLAMLMNDARRGGSGGGTVVGVGGQSVAAVPPSPGGIPSPDKMGGMMQQQQQPQMMNGGLAPLPQQMGMAQQPPPAQMGMHQQQSPTIQQSNSFGVSPEGGTVDDAFAGLSNESVNVEEYSVAGDMSAAGGDDSGFGGQQSAMGTLGGGVHQQPQRYMPIQEVGTPEPSPMPVKSTMQQTVMPPPPIQQQNQQQQTHALPPRSPRSTPRTTAPSSEDSSAELVSLREAHQKLQAEVISLRAKAASVSEEEQETQKGIAQLASEIGKLSMELSELKENVMDAKVKLGESVGILKVQLEKRGSLEAQVEEARITHEALTSANTAVEEANEMAMAQRAQSVAAAAMAKEEASVVVPEPTPQQSVETADLFSWGAPAPAEANSVAMQPPVEPASVASEISPVLTATMPPPSDVDRDSFSVYSTSGGVNANPNPYGQPLGVAPPQQQQPMGVGIPEPTNQGFDYNQQQQQSQQAGISPMGPGMSLGGGGIPEPMGYQQPPAQPQLTPPRQQESFASYNSAPAPQQVAVPSGPPSPTKAELEVVKGKTVEAEQTFRQQADLVRSISTEVVQLESVAKQAEANMTLLEGKTKKGSFVGGKKKKAKKEYEKAMEVAEAERKKVENAKAQLAAAEKEAQNAKGNVDSLRSKYEEMEMQAATAASYMSAQQQTYGDNQSVVSAQPSMASVQPTVASVQPAYNDPFGGMNMGQPPAQPTNDLYGAPMGGGGDYANPFL